MLTCTSEGKTAVKRADRGTVGIDNEIEHYACYATRQ